MKSVSVHINGEMRLIDHDKLDELIKHLKINTKFLAVAINNHVIPSSEYAITTIQSGDNIEIIQPVNGG